MGDRVLLPHEYSSYRRKSTPFRISRTVYYVQGMRVSPQTLPDVLSPSGDVWRWYGSKFIQRNLVPKSEAPPPVLNRRVYHGYVIQSKSYVRVVYLLLTGPGSAVLKPGRLRLNLYGKRTHNQRERDRGRERRREPWFRRTVKADASENRIGRIFTIDRAGGGGGRVMGCDSDD